MVNERAVGPKEINLMLRIIKGVMMRYIFTRLEKNVL